MRVIDLINVMKANVTYTYYPNTFPTTAADDCAVVKLTGGGSPDRNVSRPAFQVLIRAKLVSTADAKAWQIYDYFKTKTNFNVGSSHVIFCLAQQSTPLYIGTDDNNRHIYSVNFITITEAN